MIGSHIIRLSGTKSFLLLGALNLEFQKSHINISVREIKRRRALPMTENEIIAVRNIAWG
jgi:hypothetical protein